MPPVTLEPSLRAPPLPEAEPAEPTGPPLRPVPPAPGPVAGRRRPLTLPPLPGRVVRRPPVRMLAFGVVAVAVLGFSWGWPGRLVLDGPGVSLYVQLALDHLQHGGVPYWLPEMWAGSPAWALAPSFPIIALVPAAVLLGAETAVKLATLAAQIVGGWGVFVLAQALWGDRPRGRADWQQAVLPLTAAVIYALHPLFVSHGALFGHEPAIWVMAVTPWLAWSVRLAFQATAPGRRYAVLAGLLAGFAVLQQAEHAYGLALMCFCQLVLEFRKNRRHVTVQAGTIVAVALGVTAFWLVPFLALARSFVLTPPETVRSLLQEGIGSVLGHEPGTFLTRSHALSGTVNFEGDMLRGNVYLSWVCLVPTFLTAFLLARHDEDGHLTAVLVAGAVAVWLSTAGVPLASSGPAQRFELLPFLVIGTLTGLLVGSSLRRLVSGRAAVLCVAGALLFLVVVPYVTPFLTLRRIVPLLENIRFPRFYPVAALGVTLAAVYPLRFVARWARERQPSLAPVLTGAAALLLLGAFFVDIHPYRSFYRVRPPADGEAYRRAAETLDAVGADFRVATPLFGDPRLSAGLLRSRYGLSVGWPHPIAGRQVWRLTGEAMISPPGYREAALALSGTAYLASERLSDPVDGVQRVTGVHFERNPGVLPLVRAYDEAIVVEDSTIAPELAVSLARRNVAVVTGGPRQERALGEVSRGAVASDDACDERRVETGDLAHEVAMACSIHRWIGIFAGFEFRGVGGNLGGTFRAASDGLRGIGIWLDREPGNTELSLHEVASDGELGAEIARARSSTFDWDDSGIYAFRFPPVEDSAGKRYAFLLSCDKCDPADEPRMVITKAPRGPGNLTENGRVRPDKGAAFSLMYDHFPTTEASGTRLDPTEAAPGRWRIRTSGERPSVVVVAEAYFPGWAATVDGRSAPVLQTDGGFVGVVVGRGEHEVTLTYYPPPAAAVGRAVTAGTILLLLAAGPLARIRSRLRRDVAPDSPAGPA